MKVILLHRAELAELTENLLAAVYTGEDVRVAVDFDGFKCKVNNGRWSPPLGDIESDDTEATATEAKLTENARVIASLRERLDAAREDARNAYAELDNQRAELMERGK